MEDKDTTYAECKDYFEIPSGDVDGNVTWERIEAVTKHPVINKDGTNTMLKFTTEDEREVIVTKAKSLLKLINGKIIECDADKFKVGDYVPVTTKQIDFNETFELNLKEILPPNEYLYGSELAKAKSVIKEHHWWMKHANKTFTLPYTRSDSVVRLLSDIPKLGSKIKNTNIKDNCIYMLLTNKTEYMIPENIKMNYNFGYLVGAYMAEGSMTLHQISIANNDVDYFGPILELCKEWNITTKIYKHENKNQERWTSQDLRIYNTLLCRILDKLCGKLSHNKFVSDLIVYSNKECLRGVLDGYIGGDGSINGKDKIITMSSVSKKMLVEVQNILLVFGIYSRIYKPPLRASNNRGSLDIKQGYTIMVNGKQSHKLAQILEMKIEYKKEAIEKILKHKHEYEFAKKYELMPNEIDGKLVMEERNGRFKDVVFDRVKSIEEVPNTTDYAFDLTVENTRNFIVNTSMILNDTFHLSGIGAGSLVITESIPRLREIINVTKTKNMKTRSMKIYLKNEYSSDKNEAKKIQSKFGYTQLKNILSKSEILYDNKNGITDIAEDREFIKSYKEFTELFEIDNIDNSTMSPWVLRLIFDKESLMNKKITIQDIQESIKFNFHNDQEIDCIYSDDSANDVVMRIQIRQDSKGNFLDFIKEFEKQLIELKLRGVTDINTVYLEESNIIKYGLDGSIIPSKEWMLLTEGSNILDIMSEDSVDITRTYTNDITEFFEIFGIEATRELIYREMYQVYSSKHPNPRHVQMMSDIMTYRGKLMPIDRHGLNNNPETGPIAKACFEEVMNIFTKASLFAEKDNMKGVSANILAGQFCKSGTNAFELLIDEDKLMEDVNVSDYVDSEYFNVNETDVNKAFDNVFKKKNPVDNVKDNDFNFGFGMEKVKPFNIEENISEEKGKIIITNTMNNSVNNNSKQNVDFNNININQENNSSKQDVHFDNMNINEKNINDMNINEKNNSKNESLNIDFENIDIDESVNDTVEQNKSEESNVAKQNDTVEQNKSEESNVAKQNDTVEQSKSEESDIIKEKTKKIRIKKATTTKKK